jgi:hypothetical protein
MFVLHTGWVLSPMIGTTLVHDRIARRFGGGGMSLLCAVEDLRPARCSAIKLIQNISALRMTAGKSQWNIGYDNGR